MAYDEKLAGRIRGLLAKRKAITEKKMFGGVAFLLNGNMCVGLHGVELIVRLDPKKTEEALAEPHTRIFDMTGRPMKGWRASHSARMKALYPVLALRVFVPPSDAIS